MAQGQNRRNTPPANAGSPAVAPTGVNTPVATPPSPPPPVAPVTQPNKWQKFGNSVIENWKFALGAIIILILAYLLIKDNFFTKKERDQTDNVPPSQYYYPPAQPMSPIHTKKIELPKNGVDYILEVSDKFPNSPNYSHRQSQKSVFETMGDVLEFKDRKGNLYEIYPGNEYKVNIPPGTTILYVRSKFSKSGKLRANFEKI